MLKAIKHSGIQAIWTGIGLKGEEEVFARAAELSCGRFVVAEDPGALSEVFAEVLEQIVEESPYSDKTVIRLDVVEDAVGGTLIHVATEQVEFPIPPIAGPVMVP